ncbi:MAG TPA: DNA adenine methylase [Candidatus Saccharimonadales bacterium]|nr:DNA adenine methylase [Candidatus Saccharimonadales bacterium]
MQTLIIHGRQPALGRAELESLFGADALKAAGRSATIVDKDPAGINFFRLGGMVKFCKVLTEVDTTDWNEIEQFLIQVSPGHADRLDAGKLTIGLSLYGFDVTAGRINATGLKLKKAVKNTGRPVRIVPNKQTELNAAQVLHNKLTQKLGWELVFVRNGHKTLVAQSIAVQDIESYAARDQARPYRDARIGMLPPKLAQIIINLAVNQKQPKTLCDPFCGSGVVLQEALLMGYDATGSDINPRMVEYTEKNLDWLIRQGRKVCPGAVEPGKNYSASVADAAKIKINEADTIASEVFLGSPLSSLPDSKKLSGIIQECDEISEKFLKNTASQTKSGFRMCLAVPAWKIKNGFLHLSTLDKLADLGYNRVSFVNASEEELIYFRPEQVVARELIVLERK